MSCVEKFIDALEEIKYDNIPDEVVKKAKDLLIDYIGVFGSGSSKPESKVLYEAFGKDKIFKNLEDLAFWMGSTSRLIDLDDGHRFAMAHPGVGINSAALSVALNTSGISGKKMIEAIVKGYEMYCYQGRAINPSGYLQRGVDATSVCGSAAVAVVVGTLMNFNKKQMVDAVSLAASLCGGLNQSAIDGSAEKYLVAGWAGKLGILAANLAKFGMGGPIGIFEGRLGYCNAFSADPDLEHLNNAKVIWDIKYAYTKKYSCVRRIHATLDAVSIIMKRENLKLEQIEKINVYGCKFIVQAGGYDPKDLVQAQTSIPYAVALLLKHGEITEELVHGNIGNADISELSKRIQVIEHEEFVQLAEKEKSFWGAARAEIITKDSQAYNETVITPMGELENPFSDEAIHNKYVKLVSEVFEKEKVEKIWNTVSKLEEILEINSDLLPLFDSVITE